MVATIEIGNVPQQDRRRGRCRLGHRAGAGRMSMGRGTDAAVGSELVRQSCRGRARRTRRPSEVSRLRVIVREPLEVLVERVGVERLEHGGDARVQVALSCRRERRERGVVEEAVRERALEDRVAAESRGRSRRAGVRSALSPSSLPTTCSSRRHREGAPDRRGDRMRALRAASGWRSIRATQKILERGRKELERPDRHRPGPPRGSRAALEQRPRELLEVERITLGLADEPAARRGVELRRRECRPAPALAASSERGPSASSGRAVAEARRVRASRSAAPSEPGIGLLREDERDRARAR